MTDIHTFNPKAHVGFTGTQEAKYLLEDEERYIKLINILYNLRDSGCEYFHHGDCVGSDAIAHTIARGLGYHVVLHPPEKDIYRAFKKGAIMSKEVKPYLERNKDIVDASHVLVAVAKDPEKEELRSGTWSTIRYARKVQKQILMA